MKGLLQTFSSLIIALVILLGILFLPDAKMNNTLGFLSFLSKAKETTAAFEAYFLRNITQGIIAFLILGVLTIYARKKIQG